MNIHIKKLEELKDAKHPDNIPVEWEYTFPMKESAFQKPVIGKQFWPSNYWRTSPVQEIIDENTFRTMNSIYHWEILNDES